MYVISHLGIRLDLKVIPDFCDFFKKSTKHQKHITVEHRQIEHS